MRQQSQKNFFSEIASGYLDLSVGQATKEHCDLTLSLHCRHLIYKRDNIAVVVASNLYYLCNSLPTLKSNKASKYTLNLFGLTKFLGIFY